MGVPSNSNPNSQQLPPSHKSTGSSSLLSSVPRPAIRVTSAFDSASSVFFHKVSCRLFDRLAKLKLSFQNDAKGNISFPHLGFLTKNLSVIYDVEARNALVKSSFSLGHFLHFRAAHAKEQRGEVSMLATLANPSYNLELSSSVSSNGLPRTTFRFPLGEVSLEEKEDKEAKHVLSINGILKGQIMNGVCTVLYNNNDLNLRYLYKDEEFSFIPSISLPSKVLSFAFKRRFSPSDKLSYWYHFNSSQWSTVYKHTLDKDNLKLVMIQMCDLGGHLSGLEMKMAN